MEKNTNAKKSSNQNQKKSENLEPSEPESKATSEARTSGETEATTFNLGRCFVKKMEFNGDEAAKTMYSDQAQPDPTIKIEISLNNNDLQKDFYEVNLTAKIIGTTNNQPFFTASIVQTGIFNIKNSTKQQLDFLLAAYCPTLIFPYVRENIASMMSRAGFKTLGLPTIDFMAAYQQFLKKQKASKPEESKPE